MGQTPLMYATLNNDSISVEMLLNAGANHQIGENDGYTPMDGANYNGFPDVLKILLQHNVPTSNKHNDGYTPIHRACWGSSEAHTKCIELLITIGNVNPLEMSGHDNTDTNQQQE